MKFTSSGRILIPHHLRRELDAGMNYQGRGELELFTDGKLIYVRLRQGGKELQPTFNCDQAERLGSALIQAARKIRTRLVDEAGQLVGSL